MPTKTTTHEEKTQELIAALEKEEGHSKKTKYIPLVEQGLAWTFPTPEGPLSLLKGSQSASVHTFMIRIPVMEAHVNKDAKAYHKFTAYKEVAARWILAMTKEDAGKDLLKELFRHSMSEFFFVSIPHCLIKDFLTDISQTKDEKDPSKIKEITIEVKTAECPDCGETFYCDSNEGMLTCHHCGFDFAG